MLKRLIALAVLLIVVPGFAEADIGRIKRSKGAATVERGGVTMEAAIGLALEASDILLTGPDGRISVTFIDNSRFSAGPNSRVVSVVSTLGTGAVVS